MLFVIIGHDAPGSKERRMGLRPAHLDHLGSFAKAGRVALAGPFTDGSGSLIVLDADSLEEAQRIAAADPYVTGGVFERVEVRPFRKVLPEG